VGQGRPGATDPVIAGSSPATPKEPGTLSKPEIGRIRAVLDRQGGQLADRDRLIFELLLGTGIRLGSLVTLNISDVELQTGTLHIRLKGGTEGRVFLNPGLRRLLRHYLKESATRGECGPDTPLFWANGGHRLGARQIQLRFAKLPHVRHQALRKDRRLAPGSASTGAPADYDNGGVCEGVRQNTAVNTWIPLPRSVHI